MHETHIAPFTTNATAIGITTTEVTDLQTKTAAARAAFVAQQDAKQASEVATEAYHNAVDAMSVAGAALLKKIRAKAEQTGDPEVYTMAAIPGPATPQPKGDPGTPAELTVELDGNGALVLKWKCANPAGVTGTFYQVYRNDAGNIAGPFEFLGVAGIKRFEDGTVPAGATALVYKIRAIRTTRAGMWATFNVVFGANTGGGTTVTAVADAKAPKLAA